MRLIHLADLHIGKRVNEFIMLEEQEYALKQVIEICDKKKTDAVLMSGDIYDRSIPVAEAVKLFDWFLTELCRRGQDIFIISGNHDSAQRLDFGKAIVKNSNIFIEGVFQGEIKKITRKDGYGNINIYMLPFIRADDVKNDEGKPFSDYTDAVGYLVDRANIDKEERNIILSHQFVTKNGEETERCDSESITIGGIDNVDCSVYSCFDYAALGHLHSPRKVGEEKIRYAGSLLKYSFSEAMHKKSVPIVELKEKGNTKIELIPLKPLRDMRDIKGSMEEIIKKEGNRDDYIRAIITDEEEIYDAIGRLRQVYPNIMKLEFENRRSVYNPNSKTAAADIAGKSPYSLFSEFFEIQNNVEMNEEQKKLALGIFREIEGDKNETD